MNELSGCDGIRRHGAQTNSANTKSDSSAACRNGWMLAWVRVTCDAGMCAPKLSFATIERNDATTQPGQPDSGDRQPDQSASPPAPADHRSDNAPTPTSSADSETSTGDGED